MSKQRQSMWSRLLLSKEIAAHRKKLFSTKVLLVGAGGIGAEVAVRMGGMGIGRMTIVDGDTVELHNTPQSSVFLPRDVGRNKASVVAWRLRSKYPDAVVTAVPRFIQQVKSQRLYSDSNVIICAPDNDQTRIWVNYYAVKFGKPAAFLGVGGPNSEWTGYCLLYRPKETACFLCLARGGKGSEANYDPVGPSRDPELNRKRCGGVNMPAPMLSPVVAMLSSVASSMVARELMGLGWADNYVFFDLTKPSLLKSRINPSDDCDVCSFRPEYEVNTGILNGAKKKANP